MNIVDMPISQMADMELACPCGRHHSVGIKKILLSSGAASETGAVLRFLGVKRVYLLCDENTYAAAGQVVCSSLEAAGLPYHTHCLGTQLIPDERAIGSALFHMEKDDDLILAVGSGTINDLSRLLSARLHIPYVIVCTAPSMDGYASTVSPMIIEGNKITLEGVFPTAIIADTSIMKDAPMDMLRSGYGDIVGKFTALGDWALARNLFGEYFCDQSAALMRGALKRCTDNAPSLQSRDENAVGLVTDGLISAGIAMGLVGNSRPASGAEHHFAHYWEVALLKANKPHPLHGNCVGAATVVSASIYEFFPELAGLVPKPQQIQAYLRLAGCAADPCELGIEQDLFRDSVLHAMEIRERYTILRYAAKKNRLSAYADTLTQRYYK